MLLLSSFLTHLTRPSATILPVSRHKIETTAAAFEIFLLFGMSTLPPFPTSLILLFMRCMTRSGICRNVTSQPAKEIPKIHQLLSFLQIFQSTRIWPSRSGATEKAVASFSATKYFPVFTHERQSIQVQRILREGELKAFILLVCLFYRQSNVEAGLGGCDRSCAAINCCKTCSSADCNWLVNIKSRTAVF